MSGLQSRRDEELLELMASGDQEALAILYRRHQGAIYRFARQMSGSEAIAEDVTQDVFLVMIRNGHRFDAARGSLQTYLYGVGRNLIRRRLRRERLFLALTAAEPLGEETIAERLVAADDPERDLASRETVRFIRRAILTLPSRYREALILCELHGLSYVDAAAVIGCQVGTLRSRLHRARSLLSRKLHERQAAQAQPHGSRVARCFT
jgi:RNA polymerase sigma-70 factor (ECF subfamily)